MNMLYDTFMRLLGHHERLAPVQRVLRILSESNVEVSLGWVPLLHFGLLGLKRENAFSSTQTPDGFTESDWASIIHTRAGLKSM